MSSGGSTADDDEVDLILDEQRNQRFVVGHCF